MEQARHDQTGGDYYDWLVLPDGKAFFVIADATGHGIGPALLIAVCRAYLREPSSRSIIPLEAVLAQVNPSCFWKICPLENS